MVRRLQREAENQLRHLPSVDTMNAFILRIAWSAMSRDTWRIKMAQAIADILHNELEPDRQVDRSELKVKNIGYSDYKA